MKTKNISSPLPAPSQLVTDEYHGVKVEDHYRNLENLEDPVVQTWLKQQSDYASAVLTKIPRRQFLLDKQLEFGKRKSHFITCLQITVNNQYFYLKKMGGEKIAKLYYRKKISSSEELLYDPKDFKPETQFNYTINFVYPDWNGEKIVISLTKNGEEISEMLIMEVATQKLLPDLITNCKPWDTNYVSWLPDNSGFLYLHYPVIDNKSEAYLKSAKSVYYKLGQNTNQLKEVFSATNNPELNIQPEESPETFISHQDSKYVTGEVSAAVKYNDTYYAKMINPSLRNFDWKFLFSKAEIISAYIIKEEEIIFLSGKQSSNFQICKTSLNHPDFKKPKVLVKEKKAEVILSMVITSNGLFYVTNKNGVEAKLYHLKNEIETELVLPQNAGRIELESKGEKHPELWIYITGWANARSRYKYNFTDKTFEDANLFPSTEFQELKDLIVKEVLVKSHDGEEVPLSIIHKKDLPMNGKNPVIIIGYGAYGISMNPFFNPNLLLFAKKGGILTIAHVRGGGEKGVEWYNGGKKATKPNSWKDLIACTEYMINKKYTSNQHTAIWGASAGGILVGRAMTARPDLFAVVISEAGTMNPVRLENSPSGANASNVEEVGTVENPEEFNALFEMDAYLHLKKGVEYPATLLTAGMNDPRVVVWLPAKFAAKLQAYQQSNKPILFLVDFAGGHRRGSFANVFAFTFWQTGHPQYQLTQ